MYPDTCLLRISEFVSLQINTAAPAARMAGPVYMHDIRYESWRIPIGYPSSFCSNIYLSGVRSGWARLQILGPAVHLSEGEGSDVPSPESATTHCDPGETG